MRPKIKTGTEIPTAMPTLLSLTVEFGSVELTFVTNGLLIQVHGVGVGGGGGGGGISDIMSRSEHLSLNSA